MSSPTPRRLQTHQRAPELPPGVESSQQLALSLFEELAPAGAGIDIAPASVGFQRNNIFIDIADLSLSARRAIDVAYFIAAEDPEIQETYQADLSYFKWLMAYGSNNRKHLRHVLREGQKAAIQVEDIDDDNPDADRWVSVPLLGMVGVARGKVIFEIPKQLQKHIKNPASSHFLSLRYVFKNLYAKILYDKLLPHLDVGVTPWVDIETLRKWFCLDPGSYTEFKRLSERTIKPSVKQITEVTGLNVSFSTRNVPGSKRVSDISFRVQAPKSVEDVKSPMVVLKELYQTLRDEFGLSGAQLMELINNRDEYTDDRIQRAIEYTRFHITQGKVKLPAGYLMKAIRSDFTLGQAMITIANQQATASETQTIVEGKIAAHVALNKQENDSKRKESARIGYTAFQEMKASEQDRVLEAFASSSAAKVIAMRLKVEAEDLKELYLDNPEIQDHLGYFLVQQAKRQSRAKQPTL